MICKVGGIAGLGTSEAKADISLTKIAFKAGEIMVVNVQMNNKKCKKPVKSFKIKMKRKIECLANSSNILWSQVEEIGS